MSEEVTDKSPGDHIPFRRLHRATGRRHGPLVGSQNAFRHGRRSKAFTERRRAFMMLLRRCREATRVE
jgi:hypothetical protein